MDKRRYTRQRVLSQGVAASVLLLAIAGCTQSKGPDDVATTSPSASPPVVTSVAATPEPSRSAAPTEEPPPEEQIPVAAVITIAELNGDGSLTVGGFVNGISEDDFPCTFVLVQGANALTQETTGLENNGTTACGSVTFQTNSLRSGSATVRLDYAGSEGRVTSEPTEVSLP